MWEFVSRHFPINGSKKGLRSHPTIAGGGSLVARKKRPESVSDNLTHARCACIWLLIGVEQYGWELCVKNELVRTTVAVFNADLT